MAWNIAFIGFVPISPGSGVRYGMQIENLPKKLSKSVKFLKRVRRSNMALNRKIAYIDRQDSDEK